MRSEDRRSTLDRRVLHDLTYFENSGEERRVGTDRRVTGELRDDWARISKWSSMKLEN